MKENIIITGGLSGIGEAIAKKLLYLDYNVFIISKSKKNLKNFMKDFDVKYKNNLHINYFNINNNKKFKEFLETNNIKNIKSIVHSAGITDNGEFVDNDFKSLNNVLKTNLTSIINIDNLLIPYLKNNENPSIVHISSICSIKDCKTPVAYSVSKAGLDMLTKRLSNELEKYNIRVNSVNPSITKTNFHVSNDIVERKQYNEWLDNNKHNNKNNCILSPYEIAEVIYDTIENNKINGEIIII